MAPADESRPLVQRLDLILLAAMLISLGIAAVLFWLLLLFEEEAETPALEPLSGAPVMLVDSGRDRVAVSRTPTPTRTLLATFTPVQTAIAQQPSFTPLATPRVEPLEVPELYANNPLQLQGQAKPNTRILIFDLGQQIGETVTDSAGNWQFLLVDGLAAGEHMLEVIAEDENGVQQSSAPVRLLVGIQPALTATPVSADTLVPSVTASPTITASPVVIVVTASPVAPSITPSDTSSMTATATSTVVTIASSTATETLLSPSPTVLPPSETSTATITHTATTTATPPDLTATFTPFPSIDAARAENTQTPASETAPAEVRTEPTMTMTPFPVMVTVRPVETMVAQNTNPVITNPPDGQQFVAGDIAVSGRGVPGSRLAIINQATDRILTVVDVDAAGNWQGTIRVLEAVELTIYAQDNAERLSNFVMLRVALPVQPETGGNQQTERKHHRDTILNAMIALLITAGGFAMIFAGRILYAWNSDKIG